MLLGLVIFTVGTAGCVARPCIAAARPRPGGVRPGAAVILPATFAYAGDLPTAAERSRSIGLVASMFPLSTLLGLPLGALGRTRVRLARLVRVHPRGCRSRRCVLVSRLRADRAAGHVVEALSRRLPRLGLNDGRCRSSW